MLRGKHKSHANTSNCSKRAYMVQRLIYWCTRHDPHITDDHWIDPTRAHPPLSWVPPNGCLSSTWYMINCTSQMGIIRQVLKYISRFSYSSQGSHQFISHSFMRSFGHKEFLFGWSYLFQQRPIVRHLPWDSCCRHKRWILYTKASLSWGKNSNLIWLSLSWLHQCTT